jgi:PAS domain S-box-containing protein
MKESRPISELLFDKTPDLLCFMSLDGYFIKVNRALETALGYSQEELLSKPLLDFVNSAYRAKTREQIVALANNETINLFENCYLCADGSSKWLCWNAVQLPDKTCFASARDITVSKDAQQETRKAGEKENWKEQARLNEHRLLSLIESGNDIILILGPDGVYKFVSPSVKTILNSDPEFYVGKVTFQFIHPDDAEWVQAEFMAVLETEKPVYIAPFRFNTASGDWVWIETIATNRLNDPAIEGIVINAKDVSRKRQREEEKLLIAEQLKVSNERYSLALKATKDVIWDWTLDTNSLTRSLSFHKLFGYDTVSETKEEENEHWESYIFKDDKERVLRSINCALNNPEVTYWNEEYRYLKADSTTAYIIDHGYIIRDVGGKAVRMVGAMHDITEGRKKEQHISKQNEQLMEVAMINSHELRGPVAIILGLLKLFDKTSVRNQENRDIIDYLETKVVELEGVVQRINDRIKE